MVKVPILGGNTVWIVQTWIVDLIRNLQPHQGPRVSKEYAKQSSAYSSTQGHTLTMLHLFLPWHVLTFDLDILSDKKLRHSDVDSDILFDIDSDIDADILLFDIYSDILSDIHSDILSDMNFDILSNSIWHRFWHSFWHRFWHSIWDKFWHTIWHSIWHRFWQVEVRVGTLPSGACSWGPVGNTAIGSWQERIRRTRRRRSGWHKI